MNPVATLPRGVADSEVETGGMSEVMSPQDLADYFSVSLKTVERWRIRNEGPESFRLPGERMIRYHRADVIEWTKRLRNKKPGVAAPGQNTEKA